MYSSSQRQAVPCRGSWLLSVFQMEHSKRSNPNCFGSGTMVRYQSAEVLKDSVTALSYRVHYDATVKAFSALGMHSKAKTHAAHGSGSRMAERAGASESHLRRLGRWNVGAMEGCYLTALPRDAMRSLAGFSPDRRSSFWSARRSFHPNHSSTKCFHLLKTIWQHTRNSQSLT